MCVYRVLEALPVILARQGEGRFTGTIGEALDMAVPSQALLALRRPTHRTTADPVTADPTIRPELRNPQARRWWSARVHIVGTWLVPTTARLLDFLHAPPALRGPRGSSQADSSIRGRGGDPDGSEGSHSTAHFGEAESPLSLIHI